VTHSSAGALETALASLGIACTVESHQRLAVIRQTDGASLEDPGLRRAVVRLARAHGFAAIAVEMTDPPAATESGVGDLATIAGRADLPRD
jgi:hypothetical protein